MPEKVNPTHSRRNALGIKAFSWLHRVVYRLTGGRLLGVVVGAPVLLLTTTGHRTGRERTKPLLYLMEDDAYVVVASYAGMPANPAWYRNLQSHPVAMIQVKNSRIRVKAETAPSEAREGLWTKLTAMYPGYADYQDRTRREIPVVILRPAGPPKSNASV